MQKALSNIVPECFRRSPGLSARPEFAIPNLAALFICKYLINCLIDSLNMDGRSILFRLFASRARSDSSYRSALVRLAE